jgi:hypothetical protein
MLIRVIYDDGRFDMVKPQMLDTLLGTNKVTSFKRNKGWTVIGRDPLRRNKSNAFHSGPERRLAA